MHRGQLCIGGVSVQVVGSSSAGVIFDSSLQPFRVSIPAPHGGYLNAKLDFSSTLATPSQRNGPIRD